LFFEACVRARGVLVRGLHRVKERRVLQLAVAVVDLDDQVAIRPPASPEGLHKRLGAPLPDGISVQLQQVEVFVRLERVREHLHEWVLGGWGGSVKAEEERAASGFQPPRAAQLSYRAAQLPYQALASGFSASFSSLARRNFPILRSRDDCPLLFHARGPTSLRSAR
jgi:hypothetical protein